MIRSVEAWSSFGKRTCQWVRAYTHAVESRRRQPRGENSLACNICRLEGAQLQRCVFVARQSTEGESREARRQGIIFLWDMSPYVTRLSISAFSSFIVSHTAGLIRIWFTSLEDTWPILCCDQSKGHVRFYDSSYTMDPSSKQFATASWPHFRIKIFDRSIAKQWIVEHNHAV